MSNDSVSQTPIMYFVYAIVVATLVALLCTTRKRRQNREKYRAQPTLWRVLPLDQWVMHTHSVAGIFVASPPELAVYSVPERLIILVLKLETIYMTSAMMPILNPESFEEDDESFTVNRFLESLLVSFLGTVISISLGIPLFKKSFQQFRDSGWLVVGVSCAVLVVATGVNTILTFLPRWLPGYSLNIGAVLSLWATSVGVSWIINEPVFAVLKALLFLETAVPVSSNGNGSGVPASTTKIHPTVSMSQCDSSHSSHSSHSDSGNNDSYTC